jgi:hypothetical protein
MFPITLNNGNTLEASVSQTLEQSTYVFSPVLDSNTEDLGTSGSYHHHPALPVPYHEGPHIRDLATGGLRAKNRRGVMAATRLEIRFRSLAAVSLKIRDRASATTYLLHKYALL